MPIWTTSMNIRTCLQCGARIGGRMDKKFCGDRCRNHYHNGIKNGLNLKVRQVNRILSHNRQVMQQILPGTGQNTTVPRSRLLADGFDFKYHTHTQVSRSGQSYVFCYEYGYRSLEDEAVMLVRQESVSRDLL